MANREKKLSDSETILMALDQISQTIDVMNSVVGRLRNYVQRQDTTAIDRNQDTAGDAQSERVLH